MNRNTNRLNIRLLGTPEIQLEGKALVLSNIKARALLFFQSITLGHDQTDEILPVQV